MPYAQNHSLGRNASTAFAVAAIQGIAAVGIISAFSAHFLPPKAPPPFGGYQVPNTNTPKPPPIPKPPKDPVADLHTTKPLDHMPPVPPIGGGTIDKPFDFGTNSAGEGLGGGAGEGSGGGVGEAEFPKPDPTPITGVPARGAVARGNPGLWVTQIDYPTREIAAGHEGRTQVRLAITSAGRVSQCEVVSSSGYPGLDMAACMRLRSRARFDPATDGSGQATDGSYTTAVQWKLPE